MSSDVVCGHCGGPVPTPRKDRPREFRYCSWAHYQAHRRVRFPPTRIPRNCSTCEIPIEVEPYRNTFRTFCSVRCRAVYGASLRSTAHPVGATRLHEGTGYIRVKTGPRGPDWGFEHRKVMEEKLGRKLRKGENVHHVNGVRTDNRPENLELWVIHQPKGQRPEDLVAYAREILARYGEVA